MEGQHYLAALARRFIRGKKDLHHRACVAPGNDRFLVILHAIDEMIELAPEAVIPLFLIDGERPALGGATLFDGIFVARPAIGEH